MFFGQKTLFLATISVTQVIEPFPSAFFPDTHISLYFWIRGVSFLKLLDLGPPSFAKMHIFVYIADFHGKLGKIYWMPKKMVARRTCELHTCVRVYHYTWVRACVSVLDHLTLFNPGFLVLNLLGGGQICPHPLTMGVMGGRFQNWVGTSYLTEIDARQKDLPLSDT